MTEPRATGSDGHCIVCGGRDWRLTLRSPDLEYQCKPGTWDLVACVGCGHVSVHPLPEPEEVASLYPPTYYTVNKASPLWLDGAIYEKKLAADAVKLRRSLAAYPIRSIVDVGAGEISRLIELKRAFGEGVETIALDIQFDPHIQEQARQNGIRLVVGNVETDVEALRDGGHSLIIMRQLIEHLRDPERAVANLARKMHSGALMLIDTPNRGGLDHTLFRGKYWGGYHVPRHFHLFNQEHLAKIVERAGLRVHRAGCIPSMGFWIISLRLMMGLNSISQGPGFKGWFLRYKNLPLSAFFILFDLVRAKLGMRTSNQFVHAIKP